MAEKLADIYRKKSSPEKNVLHKNAQTSMAEHSTEGLDRAITLAYEACSRLSLRYDTPSIQRIAVALSDRRKVDRLVELEMKEIINREILDLFGIDPNFESIVVVEEVAREGLFMKVKRITEIRIDRITVYKAGQTVADLFKQLCKYMCDVQMGSEILPGR